MASHYRILRVRFIAREQTLQSRNNPGMNFPFRIWAISSERRLWLILPRRLPPTNWATLLYPVPPRMHTRRTVRLPRLCFVSVLS